MHIDTLVKVVKKLSLYVVGVGIPILIVLFYFHTKGAVHDFFYYTIYVVLGPYRNSEVIQGDGLWILFGFLSILFPFLVFWKKNTYSFSVSFLVFLFAIALFPSLLPSFLSYRAYTIFPFISIIAGSNIAMLFRRNSISIQVKLIILVSFVLFSFFTYRFFDSYISGIRDGEIAANQLLKSYGKTEYEIVDWIKTNTNANEKIINYGSEMIYLLSNRLPKNKYVDPFPYILKPYESSLRVFTQNPPIIVVYDESLPNDHPGLSEWTVLAFFNTKYKIVKRFDKNLVIYKYFQ